VYIIIVVSVLEYTSRINLVECIILALLRGRNGNYVECFGVKFRSTGFCSCL
jgi:hypothetical protein